MLLKPYYLGCLAHASYRVADAASGIAAIVDPQRDIDQYLQDASQLGLDIRDTCLTQFHADFLAGHLELRERVGATVCLGARAQADYAFRPFHDGESLKLGQVRLDILETPGHTPEAICIVATDLQHDPDHPHAVRTGDTLFIGDVGRPDMMASVGVSQEVPRDRQVVLQCAGGYRSAIATSILANHGMTEIADLVGGLAAWEEMGLDLEVTT